MLTRFPLFAALSFYLLLNNTMLLSVTHLVTDPREGAGFFSTFHDVMGALNFYDKEKEGQEDIGLKVDFENKGLFYDESKGSNWWNYYFEPIALGESDGTEQKLPGWKKCVLSFEAQFDLSRERYYELIQKYVILKPHMRKMIETFVEKHFENSPVIGVHYRGTDKESEAPSISYEEVCNRISEGCTTLDQKSMKIFIATDEEKFLNYASERFPGKVVSSNAIRSPDNSPVHLSKTGTPYERGEGAVLDCWLLARCCALYKMASNLSDAAMKINPQANLPVVHLNSSYFEDCARGSYGVASTLNTVLSLLDRYEKNEIKGVKADFCTKGKNYDEGVNWWNYHFEPLEVGNNDNFERMKSYQVSNAGNNNLFEMPRSRAQELLCKYIVLQSKITKKVNKCIDQFNGVPVIGIHYYKQPGLEPEELTPHATVLEQVEKYLAQNEKKSELLLITNDESFFEKACTQYPHAAYSYKPPREKRLKQEKHDLIDSVLLSKANKVIGTASVVLKLAAQWNANLDVQTVDEFWAEKP